MLRSPSGSERQQVRHDEVVTGETCRGKYFHQGGRSSQMNLPKTTWCWCEVVGVVVSMRLVWWSV